MILNFCRDLAQEAPLQPKTHPRPTAFIDRRDHARKDFTETRPDATTAAPKAKATIGPKTRREHIACFRPALAGSPGINQTDAKAHPSTNKSIRALIAIPSLTMIDAGKFMEDPHWWHSLDNMKVATRLVTQAFEHADPKNAAYYRKHGKDYLTNLEELQRWTRVKVAELPHSMRILVTSHDALQYFARDNGFSIDPVKGISTTEEPSSRHVRDIIELIRKERVKAVFFESIENPQALERITSETGAKPGGILYSDGLGKNEASTYDSMMRHNVTTIVDALKPDAG
jgi:ABC-type Zn uptake system ZnuABC Zn-binding protein ZnuA